jgi:hypothetical protein
MVSSTYFDLKEIRQQLAAFIEGDLGYRSLISESGTFPIDPSATAIENCRRRVEENADILVLVIGPRYGAIDERSQRSITNLEYLAARAKGIPIYAFVDKSVLAVYEVWQAKSGDDRAALGDSLGDSRLFAFLEQVRATDSVWMNGFDNAAGLISILRSQLSYLVGESLEIRRTLTGSPHRDLLRSLSGRAFRIAVEKPSGWEHLLFGTVLDDEIQARAAQRQEFDLKLAYGASVNVDSFAMLDWTQARMSDIERLVTQANDVVNDALVEALGPPGLPGD